MKLGEKELGSGRTAHWIRYIDKFIISRWFLQTIYPSLLPGNEPLTTDLQDPLVANEGKYMVSTTFRTIAISNLNQLPLPYLVFDARGQEHVNVCTLK